MGNESYDDLKRKLVSDDRLKEKLVSLRKDSKGQKKVLINMLLTE